VDRVDGEARWNEDHRRVRAGLVDRLGDGVEDRDSVEILAALAGRDAGDDVRAVVPVPQRVEGAFAAGCALDDELRLIADDDRHQRCDFLALSTSLTSLQAVPSAVIRSESSSLTRSASLPAQPVRASQSSSGCTFSKNWR